MGQGSRNIPRPSWQPILHQHSHVRDRRGVCNSAGRETSPMLTRPGVSDQASESSHDAAPKGMARADLASWRLAWWWNTSLSLPDSDGQGPGVDLSASRCTSSRTSQIRFSSPDRASSLPTRKRLGASPTSHLGMSGPCEATDLQAWCRRGAGSSRGFGRHTASSGRLVSLCALGARDPGGGCNNLADGTLRNIVFLYFPSADSPFCHLMPRTSRRAGQGFGMPGPGCCASTWGP